VKYVKIKKNVKRRIGVMKKNLIDGAK